MAKVSEAWKWLKLFGTQQQKDLFRPVYAYIQQLEKRIKELELMHDKHMAPQMFEKKSDKEILVQIQIEKTRKAIEAAKLARGLPLKDRLQIMIRDNKVGSDEWIKTLKWNNLTEKKAKELVDGNDNQKTP